jgi:hypothetical protein
VELPNRASTRRFATLDSAISTIYPFHNELIHLSTAHTSGSLPHPYSNHPLGLESQRWMSLLCCFSPLFQPPTPVRVPLCASPFFQTLCASWPLILFRPNEIEPRRGQGIFRAIPPTMPTHQMRSSPVAGRAFLELFPPPVPGFPAMAARVSTFTPTHPGPSKRSLSVSRPAFFLTEQLQTQM